MTIKGAIYRGRTRTVEDAVEAWKAQHEEADCVKDIEDVVVEWLYAFDVLREWQFQAYDYLHAGLIRDVLDYGERLRQAYEVGEKLHGQVAECVAWAEGRDYAVDRADDFRKALRALELLRIDFEKKWPAPDHAKLKDALASLDRGEGIEIGGWLSEELQGTHSP